MEARAVAVAEAHKVVPEAVFVVAIPVHIVETVVQVLAAQWKYKTAHTAGLATVVVAVPALCN
jgi:hypothetical protein